MYASEALEPSRAQPEPARVGDEDILVISHKDRNYIALAGDEQGNLSLDFE